jgi:serine/threonine-protein kinase HipA
VVFVANSIVPMYFSGVNISKADGSQEYANGQLLRFGRGVYIDNVFSLEAYAHLELEDKIKLLHETVTEFSPWIASYITPNATLICSSAYFGQSNKDGTLFIDGVTSGRTSLLGENFFEDNKRGLKDDLRHIQNVDVSLKLERIRTKEPVSADHKIHVPLPEILLNTAGMLRYASNNLPAKDNLLAMQASLSTPIRTLVDICRWPSDDPRSLNDIDFIDTCSFAGISFVGGNLENDLAKVREIINLESVTPSVIVELQRRIEPLLYSEQNRHLHTKDVDSALKHARIQFKIDHPENLFEVYHFDRKVANLVDVGGHEWAVRGEGWLLPLDPKDLRMPPMISNLMPEIVKITPPEYLSFFKQSSRFMSNIQIIESGMAKGLNDYHETLLNDDQIFSGSIQDVPTFSADFDYQNTEKALHDAIPRCSGVQIKLPMNLSEVDGKQVLSLAANKSFTHLLKLASQNDQALVIGEWVGMHISQAVGAETARFQLINLSNSYGNRVGYITERFDILSKEHSSELLSCDLCALMGVGAEEKYNATMEIAAKVVQMNSQDFESDRYRLFAMTVAGLLADNTDLHLKNISMLRDETVPDAGFRLSPVYDMVVTSVLPSFAHGKQALTINSTNQPELSDVVMFAQQSLGIEPEQCRNYIEMACEQVDNLMDTLSNIFPAEFKYVPEYEASLERCIKAVRERISIFQPSLQNARQLKLDAELTNNMGIEELLAFQERQQLAEEDVPVAHPKF